MRVVLFAGLFAVSSCGPSASGDGCKDKLLPGDIVITEVFADAKAPPGGSGTDEGKEWFEIYNATDRPVELKGMTVTHSRPDGVDKAKSHVMDDMTIGPGQFLTLGNTTPDLVRPFVDYGYSADLGDFFNSDGGKLVLQCKSTLIDGATYESVKEGHARQLSNAQPPDYSINDDPSQWCQADDSEFETGNFGTPGSDSDCAPVIVGQCSEGGAMRDAVSPMPGDLVITEVMPNPGAVSDTAGEWFEVLAKTDVDLNGVGLDRAGDSSNPNLVNSATCIRLRTGQYAVFAKNADMTMNGGLPNPISGTFSFALIDGTAAAPGDVRLMAGTNVIDAVTWTSSRSARSHALDPDFLNAADNDAESNFCDGSTVFGSGDQGTPGVANPQCAGSTVGMCDPGTGVLRPIVRPIAGQVVITEFLANPANVTGFTDAQREWFEIKNTGIAAFDLNELGLARTGGTANVIQSAMCKPVAAGGYALFARSNDPAVNAMLPAVDAVFTFSLIDTTGNIEVRDNANAVLDVITYPSVTSGVSKSLDPDQQTTAGNDTPANFCAGVGGYGDMSNMGTPKADNAQCP
ncbi:MAG: lamin tail domain-containing protein [Deltaproteobacteria bacterium]|nr:lamin tail domain-containing protein [Deltaproteobacteria bacterium]